jgi:Niemann-Pick C1 protein
VGFSVFLTTTTSVVAFALGCTSSIPAVFWLCQYAAPTIAINFLYQLTFFVALIIIDERRVADKRRDWIVCSTVRSRVRNSEVEEGPQERWFDRFMGWYADFLFQPIVSAFVMLGFAGLLAACAYATSKLTQEFQFTDVVPKDSYVADFWNEFTTYSERTGVRPGVYFRFVDQCDPVMQQQMEEYVNNLVALDEVSGQPFYFWLQISRALLTRLWTSRTWNVRIRSQPSLMSRCITTFTSKIWLLTK